MFNEKFQGLEMIENKEPREPTNRQLIDVFKNLGILEERINGVEKQNNIISNNQIQLEKDIFKKFDEVINTVNSIDKQLYANSMIEKERKENQSQEKTDRRENDKIKIEERKIGIGYWPIVFSAVALIISVISNLWNFLKSIPH